MAILIREKGCYECIYNNIYVKIVENVIGTKIKRNPHGEKNEDAVNIAWAVQKVTEEAVLAMHSGLKAHRGKIK